MSGMTPTQRRVHALVDQYGAVTSKRVAAELGTSTGWALRCLSALVEAGAIDVRNADGGTYEWLRR
jgi:predicted ArsR family transcriptional regulator